MQLFYLDNIESNICTLNEEESKHCVRVLRLDVGNELYLTDGKGTMCRCIILDANAKRCSVVVVERHTDYGKHPFHLHVAIAPTKNPSRMEWFVEKAVELGIDEITPLVCDHSERNVLKTERIERIAVSAMKQSLKAFMPIVNSPTPVDNVIAMPFDGQRFIGHCIDGERTPLCDVYKRGSNALILIGPEGDFSNREVQLALNGGFVPVTLGQWRLRTETAALSVTAFFNLVNS